MRDADDRSRLAAVRAGDANAVSRFLAEISATVWTASRLLCCDEPEARVAFGEIMAALRANHFARLSAHSGRGTLDTFVALAVRDLLAERMLRILQSDRQNGWRAFERMFQVDMQRLIRRRIPATAQEEARRDAYQDICLSLIENDYRRLKAYSGNGSFAGFVLRMVDRLLIDHLRGLCPRRRLPASIARLSPLDQEIFRLVAWRRIPQRADLLAPYLAARLGAAPSPAEIDAALGRVGLSAVTAQDGIRLVHADDQAREHADPAEQTPEERLVAQEEHGRLTAALAVMERAMGNCPPEERLYLTIALGGAEPRPAREIADLMRRPVEDIYKLKQRVIHRLRDALASDDAVKIWRASV
jgi:RNA polymerase primary sigma factor